MKPRFIETRRGQQITLALVVGVLVASPLFGWWLGAQQKAQNAQPEPVPCATYEDGSWVCEDGRTGCLEGELCE